MSRHLLAEVLVWAGLSCFAAGIALLVARGVRDERRHKARIARYQEATWQGARDALGLPSKCDPFVTNPENPQRGDEAR